MKKILSLLVVLAFVFSLSANVFAAATSLGFIDVEKVFYGYKDTKKALDKLSEKEKEFKTLKEKKEEEVYKMVREGKPQADIDKAKKAIETELEPKVKEIQEYNNKVTSEIREDIIKAVKEVSKQVGVEIVVDKKAIITGHVELGARVGRVREILVRDEREEGAEPHDDRLALEERVDLGVERRRVAEVTSLREAAHALIRRIAGRAIAHVTRPHPEVQIDGALDAREGRIVDARAEPRRQRAHAAVEE